jgi:ABC-2 type transport system ATP-binding protein
VKQSTAVEVQKLRKVYINRKTRQTKEALRGIDLAIPEGSIFGLLGKNGAGKTTVINILAGITTKTSGTVRICGYDIDQDMRASRYAIGVVPQELVLDPFFTVRETLENHAGYYAVPKEKRKTQEILKNLGLLDKADQKPGALSGGMKRRLLIGKALVHSPRVLVLDEPTAGVDIELREQLWNYVKELNNQGTTIILTTHYLAEAQELCSHVGIIDDGLIVAADRKDVLLQNFAKKTLTLLLEAPIAKIPAALQPFNATLTEAHNIQLHYVASEHGISDIMEAAHAAGLRVRDINIIEPNLEDVYRTFLHINKPESVDA